MKLHGKIFYIFLLLATFHLSVQMVQPTLSGNFIGDSHPLIEQKAVTMLPISQGERETGYERPVFQPENSIIFSFCNAVFEYNKAHNFYLRQSREHFPPLTSSDLLNRLCILRI